MKHFLFLLAALLSVESAFACRCRPPDVWRAYAQVQAVASVRIKTVTAAPSGGVEQAEADVIEAWKSDLPDSITIFGALICEYPLQEGGDFVLYLNRNDKGNWTTGNCLGNSQTKDAGARIKWLRRHGKSFGKRTPKP
jgi:hypothetical protein